MIDETQIQMCRCQSGRLGENALIGRCRLLEPAGSSQLAAPLEITNHLRVMSPIAQRSLRHFLCGTRKRDGHRKEQGGWKNDESRTIHGVPVSAVPRGS